MHTAGIIEAIKLFEVVICPVNGKVPAGNIIVSPEAAAEFTAVLYICKMLHPLPGLVTNIIAINYKFAAKLSLTVLKLHHSGWTTKSNTLNCIIIYKIICVIVGVVASFQQ